MSSGFLARAAPARGPARARASGMQRRCLRHRRIEIGTRSLGCFRAVEVPGTKRAGSFAIPLRRQSMARTAAPRVSDA